MKVFVSVLIALGLLGSVAHASPLSKQGRKKRLYKQLGLTKTQISQLRRIKKATKGPLRKLQAQEKQKRRQLRKALASSSPAAKVKRLHQQISKIERRAKEKKFKKTMAIRSVLTPKQRARFYALKKQRRQRKLKR